MRAAASTLTLGAVVRVFKEADMNQRPTWIYVLQIVATLAVVATFFVYFFQLRAMQAQLSLVAQAGRAHNLITCARSSTKRFT